MENIRLDLLAAQQLRVPIEQAAALIMEGRVFMGQVSADKPGTPVPADTLLTLRETRKYASRSGYKLAKALDVFCVDVTGKTICDIGASNGGFTDCLLQNGAGHVFAVDVAYGILAWELRNHAHVTVLERTNARHLTAEQLGAVCDMVTVDVSFISLKKIYPAIRRVLKTDGVCVCLIKPQFEALKNQLGKNGIVRDPALLPPLLLSLAQSAQENGLFLQDITVSPIHGTNGNVEYLAYFTSEAILPPEQWEIKIQQALLESPNA